MRILKEKANDPVVIGYCAGCGSEIYSDDDYFVDGEEMIHANGSFCKVDTVGGKVEIPCAALYFTNVCIWEEAARGMGLERKRV